jgi:hypothetical protein
MSSQQVVYVGVLRACFIDQALRSPSKPALANSTVPRGHSAGSFHPALTSGHVLKAVLASSASTPFIRGIIAEDFSADLSTHQAIMTSYP